MRKILVAAFAISLLLVLSGCGGSSSSPPPSVTTQILSSAANDGDIALDVNNNPPVPSQGSLASVFAGINATTGTEFRAFLDFPLTGAGGVPGSAIIDAAIVDIFIDSLSIDPLAATVPIRIDLVSFPPQPLLGSDFSQPALATKSSFVTRTDANHHVSFDVTRLMALAQAQQLSHFQLRISEDLSALPDGNFDGLVEIHEATVGRAPLLEVTYH